MPKVMMISGLPLAGQYVQPPRQVHGLGYVRGPGLRPGVRMDLDPIRMRADLDPIRMRADLDPIRSGASHIYRGMVRGHLRRAGIAGLGDLVSTCNDAGMVFMQAVTAGAAGAFSTFGAARPESGDTPAVPADRGWQTAAGSLTSMNSAWTAACAAARTAAAQTDPTAAATQSSLRELEYQRMLAAGQLQSAQFALAQQQAAADDKILGMPKAVAYGGLAVLGLGIAGWLVFGKKRR